jgi:uncharacterized glyoxalase superfamily protein PhnB
MKKYIEYYRETLKAELLNSIEKQQDENSEDYYRGKEDALKYALEMLDKHIIII